MTLEEAIKHCEQQSCEHSKCAEEHKQLAEWLKELQTLKGGCDNTDKTLKDSSDNTDKTPKRHPLCKNCIWHNYHHCSKPDDEDCVNYEDTEEYRQKMLTQWRTKEPKIISNTCYDVICVSALEPDGSYGPEIARIYSDRRIEWTFGEITDKMRESVERLAKTKFIDGYYPPHFNFFND